MFLRQSLDNGRWVSYLIVLLVMISFGLRLSRINAPPLDNSHNHRQSQTLSTIEDYYANGIDLLKPKVHYVGYPGYLVLEFPLFQAIMAEIWKVTGPHVAVVRLFNLLLHACAVLLLFLILRLYFDTHLCFLASAVYALTPLNLIYSRSTLIEPFAILLSLFILYVYLKLSDIKRISHVVYYVFWVVCVILAALIKSLYLFPLGIIYIATVSKRNIRTNVLYGGALAVAAVCMVLWMRHAHVVNALTYYNRNFTIEHHLGMKNTLSFVYWMIIAQRIMLKVTTGPALILLLLSLWGLLDRSETSRKRAILAISWTCVIGYLTLFSNINMPHDYYMLIIVPYMSLLTAYGYCTLEKQLPLRYGTFLTSMLFLTLFYASGVAYLTYTKTPISVVEFRDRVLPLLDKQNKFVILFLRPQDYKLPELFYEYNTEFPRGAALYSVHKWGIYHLGKNMHDVISYISSIPRDDLKHYGEIILYQYTPYDIPNTYKSEMRRYGYKETYSDWDVKIFRRYTLDDSK